MQIDIMMFIFITFISLGTVLIFISFKKDTTYRLIIIGIGTSIYIYSGIGISHVGISFSYYFAYQLYLVSIMLGFYIVADTVKSKGIKNKVNIIFKNKRINHQILVIATVIYFLTKISYLIFPEFRLQNILIPPTLNVYGVRYLSEQFESSSILNITSLLGVLTIPFFFILLCNLIKSGKKNTVIFLIIFWGYLDYAIYEYLARSDMLTIVVFAYLVVQSRIKNFKINLKHIALATIGIVIALPILYLFEDYRLTGTVEITNIFSPYVSMFMAETSYPKYYDVLFNSEEIYGIGNYLLWIITLPVPKFIIPIEITTFNTYFTNLVDVHLDYIVLPSILGESFMIFGKYLFWMHGILLGLIIGITYRILSKYNFTMVIIIYIAVLSFSIGRGGSMQMISFCINSLFTLWLGILITRMVNILLKNGRTTNTMLTVNHPK